MGFLQKCKGCKQKKECNKGYCRDCLQSNGDKPKKSSFTHKFKKSGQLEMFIEIWNERKHVSWVSGDPIHEFNVKCFAHVLPKGTYTKWKLNKDNIVLMTEDEHDAQHFQPKEELMKDPRWVRFFTHQDKLRSEYNKLYPNVTKKL